jgi:hypothetical protein
MKTSFPEMYNDNTIVIGNVTKKNFLQIDLI